MRFRVFAVLLVMCGLVGLGPIPTASRAAPPTVPSPTSGSALLDCNGYGLANNPDHPSWRCPHARGDGPDEPRFEDNGHYIGHDEPAIEFFSTKPGSGNSARYNMTLPTDPARAPNGKVTGPVWNFQTHIAPWFGMTMCDTESFPETTKICRPNSDTNIVPKSPTRDHAGTAYMELQFYPPGWSPQISCDQKRWCAALTITSLQVDWDGVENENCVQPQTFAFVTKSGRPIGPTGPDNATDKTFEPTKDVLRMSSGDKLSISMFDTRNGFQVRITDRTTYQTGTMTAGASNRWRHIKWDPVNFTCKGEPYTFHPMFSTAAPPYPNGQPRAWPLWTAHTFNVAMSDEIGHFETPGPEDDPNGEAGPCFDGPVIPGCIGADLDFDGFSYERVWPDGNPKHPGPMPFTSPESRDKHGNWTSVMDKYRFETNLPSIQPLETCALDGTGCQNPPPGANFYPWFHTIRVDGKCAWTLSDDLPRQISNFGGSSKAAFGPALFTDYGAGFVAVSNFASAVRRNPCR
ncbi:MAG: hypothetical protein JWR85_3112 [Marmoricola sp.]|nr:hypothetical protein [Marmoricola sp.]